MNRALLAAARIGVGHVGIGLRILGELLLAQDDAVLDIDGERAIADAIDAVGRVTYMVPGPLLAVQVLPVAVRIFAAQGVIDRLELVERPGAVGEYHAGAGERGRTQEFSAIKRTHDIPPTFLKLGERVAWTLYTNFVAALLPLNELYS